MRDHTYSPFIILSAEHPVTLAEVNEDNSTLLERRLLKFREATGSLFYRVDGEYRGVREKSFLVHTTDAESIRSLAKEFGQESILVRNSHNDCHLLYVNTGQEEFIGHFVEVEFEEAIRNSAGFTIIRERQRVQYWICKKGPYVSAKVG